MTTNTVLPLLVSEASKTPLFRSQSLLLLQALSESASCDLAVLVVTGDNTDTDNPLHTPSIPLMLNFHGKHRYARESAAPDSSAHRERYCSLKEWLVAMDGEEQVLGAEGEILPATSASAGFPGTGRGRPRALTSFGCGCHFLQIHSQLTTRTQISRPSFADCGLYTLASNHHHRYSYIDRTDRLLTCFIAQYLDHLCQPSI